MKLRERRREIRRAYRTSKKGEESTEERPRKIGK